MSDENSEPELEGKVEAMATEKKKPRRRKPAPPAAEAVPTDSGAKREYKLWLLGYLQGALQTKDEATLRERVDDLREQLVQSLGL